MRMAEKVEITGTANSPLGGLTFERVLVPDGHGADDYELDEGEAYTLRAVRDGQMVGDLDYNLTDTEAHVRWVYAVELGCGVGGALVRHLAQLHPDRDLTTNGYTDEGECLRHYFE